MDCRSTISAEGKEGWFTKDAEANIDCHKKMWLWDSGSFEVITCEANRARFHCRGFYRYSPGRSPQEHMTLEKENLTFVRKAVLAVIAAVGVAIAAWIAHMR